MGKEGVEESSNLSDEIIITFDFVCQGLENYVLQVKSGSLSDYI